MNSANHKSLLAIAITLLLVIGQAALANHVISDALHGVDDNCELCHQFDRQQSALPSAAAPTQFETRRIPLHFRNTGPLASAPFATPKARGPPLS